MCAAKKSLNRKKYVCTLALWRENVWCVFFLSLFPFILVLFMYLYKAYAFVCVFILENIFFLCECV